MNVAHGTVFLASATRSRSSSQWLAINHRPPYFGHNFGTNSGLVIPAHVHRGQSWQSDQTSWGSTVTHSESNSAVLIVENYRTKEAFKYYVSSFGGGDV